MSLEYKDRRILNMHIPVLKDEAIKYLNPKSNYNIVDATIGGLGHAREIARAVKPNGVVIGIEWTPEVYEIANNIVAEEGLSKNVKIFLRSFADIKDVLNSANVKNIHGVLFDLGYSTYHIEIVKRGFSFKYLDQPLDMRYNPEKQILKASDIINKYPAIDLAEIFQKYGEQKKSFRIAKSIVEARKKKKIKKVGDLVEILNRCAPKMLKIHFATKIFQALRIEVNNELNVIEKGLKEAFSSIEEGGRIVVISFHSLEDRIVKNFFKNLQTEGKAEILTKKPIVPSEKEVKGNLKARSAKLRAIKKL